MQMSDFAESVSKREEQDHGMFGSRETFFVLFAALFVWCMVAGGFFCYNLAMIMSGIFLPGGYELAEAYGKVGASAFQCFGTFMAMMIMLVSQRKREKRKVKRI